MLLWIDLSTQLPAKGKVKARQGQQWVMFLPGIIPWPFFIKHYKYGLNDPHWRLLPYSPRCASSPRLEDTLTWWMRVCSWTSNGPIPPLIHKCKHSLRLGFHLHYGLWRQWWSQNDAPEDFPCCRTVYRPHLPGCVKSLTAKHAPSSILPKARAVMRDLSYPQMQTPVLQSPAPFKGAAHSLAEFYPMPSSLDMVQE